MSAMGLVANKMKVKLPAEVAVDAEIDLCNSGDVYFLRARLNVSLLGLEREVAQAIVDAMGRWIKLVQSDSSMIGKINGERRFPLTGQNRFSELADVSVAKWK